ncbi:MAG: serine hydrolase domain-containing protein [Pseudomonadota bacterium]
MVKAYGPSDSPEISVAIARDGELIYEGWTGQADLERAVPISRDNRFPIASISEQFTAFSTMKLAEEGKLSFDQEVRDFFPTFRKNGRMAAVGLARYCQCLGSFSTRQYHRVDKRGRDDL